MTVHSCSSLHLQKLSHLPYWSRLGKRMKMRWVFGHYCGQKALYCFLGITHRCWTAISRCHGSPTVFHTHRPQKVNDDMLLGSTSPGSRTSCSKGSSFLLSFRWKHPSLIKMIFMAYIILAFISKKAVNLGRIIIQYIRTGGDNQERPRNPGKSPEI